jgi:uncharacterized protein YjbI with pentapeptide repeats
MADEQKPEKPHLCPHPEAVGTRWGDPISEERQAELQARLDAWAAETDHGARKGPFDIRGRSDDERQRLRLTGADAFWLAEKSGRGKSWGVPNLHLEGASLDEAHLEGAELSEAYAAEANLGGAYLEESQLRYAHLEEAHLYGAHLEGANIIYAHLEGAYLIETHLEGASLGSAHLEGATVKAAHLKGASLDEAHLEGANCYQARLEGVDFYHTHLEGADLTGATFDKTSRLNGAIFTGASFDQVTFDNANLTVVDWDLVPLLGDEVTATVAAYNTETYQHKQGDKKAPTDRLDEFRAAVRANRVLAVALRSQGLNEEADRYAYRAQVLQRQVLRRQGKFGRALGAWVLDAVSGYGYQPLRSVFTYLLVVAVFAVVYFALSGAGSHTLTWNEALVVSLTAFHGRGFFATAFQPGDPQAALAALEAVIGLLIEISFIATFTQRFFAR